MSRSWSNLYTMLRSVRENRGLSQMLPSWEPEEPVGHPYEPPVDSFRELLSSVGSPLERLDPWTEDTSAQANQAWANYFPYFVYSPETRPTLPADYLLGPGRITRDLYDLRRQLPEYLYSGQSANSWAPIPNVPFFYRLMNAFWEPVYPDPWRVTRN